MVRRRKQGEKYPKGYIKKRILLFVFDFPEGVSGPDIREFLKRKYGTGERKGIDEHLEELRKKHFLIKQPQGQGKEDIWKPNPDSDVFEKIVNEHELLTDTDIAVSFVRSKHAQEMIKEHIFPMIKEKLNIEIPREGDDDLRTLILNYPTALNDILALIELKDTGGVENAISLVHNAASNLATRPLSNGEQQKLLRFGIAATNCILQSKRWITFHSCMTTLSRLHRYPELQKFLAEERRKVREIQARAIKAIHDSGEDLEVICKKHTHLLQ